MKVDFLVTCDFASEALGKLTLVGVFDRINAFSLPAVVTMGVAFRLLPDPKEPPQQRFEVRFVPPIGTSKAKIVGEISRTEQQGAAGSIQGAFNLPVPFEAYGVHALQFFVNNELVHTSNIEVVAATPGAVGVPAMTRTQGSASSRGS